MNGVKSQRNERERGNDMQTFLPYADFKKSAEVLDMKRLGKQRIEAWQIYQSLTQVNYGWKNHPIVKMWKGYEAALLFYGKIICIEWISRGYKDTMLPRFEQHLKKKTIVIPKWLGNEQFHSSHRSNLLRKDKTYYSQFNWKEPNNMPYVWIVI
jgi:hypothetical protein